MFSPETIPRDISSSSCFLLPNNNRVKHVFDGEFLKSSGLARYRSSPSSFFTTLLESGNESDSMFSALMNEIRDDDLNQRNQLLYSSGGAMKQETEAGTLKNGSTSQVVYESRGAIVGSYSIGMENQVQVRMNNGNGNGNGNCSNLVRQSSSPAGFFSGMDFFACIVSKFAGLNWDLDELQPGITCLN